MRIISSQYLARKRVEDTFARFFRHSVHAFGVTKPADLRLFGCCETAGVLAAAELECPADEVEDEGFVECEEAGIMVVGLGLPLLIGFMVASFSAHQRLSSIKFRPTKFYNWHCRAYTRVSERREFS